MVQIKTNWSNNTGQLVDAAYLNTLGAQINDNSTAISQLTTTVTQVSSASFTRTVSVVNGNTTLGNAANTEYVYFINSGVITMPDANGNKNRYTIKNISRSNITINTTSSQQIEGALTLSLSPGSAIDVFSDNSAWRVV